MEKNVASQKWTVFAFGLPDHANPGEPVTGDAANITANIKIDGAAAGATNDTNPTELEDGFYEFDLTQAETNGDLLRLFPASSTANVQVIAVPQSIYTRPANFNDFSITATTGIVSADVVSVSGDSTAADNLESQYDGTGLSGDTYPATQQQIGNLATGSAAISTTAESATVTTGTEAGGTTYADAATLDGTYYRVEDVTNVTDFYLQFDVGGDGIPSEFNWQGFAQNNGATYAVSAYNWTGASWDQIGTITGTSNETDQSATWQATTAHVGSGANLGKVRLRFYSTDGAEVGTDRVLCSYAVVSRTAGYAGGRIFYNSNASNTNTEAYVDGTAENPVSSMAAWNTLNGTLGLNRAEVSAGSSVTFAASQTGEVWYGEGWSLALGGQDISNSHFYEAIVSGTGTTGSGNPDFHTSDIGTVTLGPSDFHNCEFNAAMTAGAAGDYYLHDCKSGVAGAGSPTFDFSGLGATTNINCRNWFGGGTWTFDSNCVASIEVTKGGGHTITTGGGDVEFRGFCRSITLTTSGTSTTQIIAFTGPITINGTGGTVNIYGQHSGITDNSSGTTVNDYSVDGSSVGSSIASILEDTGTTLPATLTTIEGKVDTVDTVVDGIQTDLDNGTDGLGALKSAIDAIFTTAMSESYAADGAAPTPAQALFLIQQALTEFAISSTTKTVKKLDGSTTAATFTLDSDTSPTSITRAT